MQLVIVEAFLSQRVSRCSIECSDLSSLSKVSFLKIRREHSLCVPTRKITNGEFKKDAKQVWLQGILLQQKVRHSTIWRNKWGNGKYSRGGCLEEESTSSIENVPKSWIVD